MEMIGVRMLKFVPFIFSRFYCSHIGPTKCYIVLGDFAADGWRMCTEKINVSLEHALLSCEYNVILHSFENRFLIIVIHNNI